MAESEKTPYTYDKWRETHFGKGGSKGTKAEFEVVKEVRERYDAMRIARQTNCYLLSPNTTDKSASSTGGDWNAYWDLCDKIKLMWAEYAAFFNAQSNIKSPMSAGRIKAFLNKIKKLNFAYEAFPNNDDDRNAAKVASKLLNYIWKNSDSKNQFLLAADDAATYGNGFFREQYIVEKKMLSFARTNDLSEDELKEMQDNNKIFFSDPVEKVVTESPEMLFVPIRELFWDPVARTDHGPIYAARDVVWRRVMPVDTAKELLRNMYGTKNIDKIKATSQYVMDSSVEPFFETPKDTVGGEYVEWLEYENHVKDQYRIVVNDIPVLDQPLPLNHKELTFHKLDYDKVTGQFYHRGIPAQLANIQGGTEILSNLMTDYTYRAIKTKWMVGSSIAGEVDEDAMSDDSNIIIVDDSLGVDIRTKVQQITMAPIQYDVFRLIDIYERQATIATGIDPSQMSVMPAGKTATATLQNKEQIEATISGVIENFVEGGLKSGGRQRWANVRQQWKLPKISKIIGDADEEDMPRTIRLDNIEIKLEDKTKELTLKPSEKDYSFFDVSGYLDTKEELDIMIRPDSLEIESKALKEQVTRQNVAQLAPFMADPRNQQQMQMHPYPYINGPKWFQKHAAELRIDNDELIQPEVNDEIAIKSADDDVTRILNGENVPGTPGVSEAHRRREAQVAMAIQAKLQELQTEIDQEMQEILAMAQPQMDEMGQPIPMPAPQPDPKKQEQLKKITDTHMRLLRHLSADNLPIGVMEDVAATPQGPAPQQGGGQPQVGQPQSVPMPSQPAMANGGASGMPSNMGAQIQGGLN